MLINRYMTSLDPFFLSKFLLILISSVGAWLIVLIYLQSKKEKLKLYFMLIILFLILRYALGYFASISLETNKVIFLLRLSTATSILFLLSAYYFYILYFLKEKGKNINLEKIISFLCLFFFAVSGFTDGVIKDAVIKSWGPEIVLGGISPLLSLFTLLMSFFIIYSLIKSYFHFSKIKRSQVFYFLIGFLIFGLFELIFVVIIPAFLGTVKYAFLGSYSIVFFFIFTAYAIIKKGLFDVKIIFTTLLVALITVL
ncbi:MAG: hypothetical protein KAI72_09775, partial [Candidatus Pacebacteria bacterium]|nr:hypothetical protein [Candidatus Paceibacterota bacterium]